MIFEDAILTDDGAAILARATASEPIQWTKAKSTSDDLSSLTTTQIKELRDLPGSGLLGDVSAVLAMGATCKVSATLSNTATSDVYAVGLFAKIDGDASETLVAVARADGTPVKMTASPSKPCRLFLDFSFGIDDADTISITVSGAGYAPVSALEATNAVVTELVSSVAELEPTLLFRRAAASLAAAELQGLDISSEVVDLVARRPIGETIYNSGALVESGHEALIASDGARVFVVYSDQLVIAAFDVDNFSKLWQEDVGYPVTALAYGAGRVFVGHNATEVGHPQITALDAKTGAVLDTFVGIGQAKSLSYGESGGDGFLVRCSKNNSDVNIHTMDELELIGTFDRDEVTDCVAAHGSLVVACGIGGYYGNLVLLDCSNPASPTLIWSKSVADGNGTWCGFVGELVAYLDRGGEDKLLLFPVGRFASPPNAVVTLATNVAGGTIPVFGDFGCAYVYSGSQKLLIVSPEGVNLVLSLIDELMSVVWCGNQFVCIDVSDRLIGISSTSRPVRVLQQFGRLSKI